MARLKIEPTNCHQLSTCLPSAKLLRCQLNKYLNLFIKLVP